MRPSGEAVLAASVTFEPTEAQVVQVIARLRGCSESTAIFDNTDSPEGRRLVQEACELAGVSYLGGPTNRGTGAGLNALTSLAEAKHLSWLLYLDQDSELGEAYTGAVASAVKEFASDRRVAAIGSLVQALSPNGASVDSSTDRFDTVKYVIASGTLIRVQAARAVGGFDEDLFLDTVDHEFCLRLKALGWITLCDKRRILRHEVGTESHVLKGWPFRVSRHPRWRRELMWRNSILVGRRYYRIFPLLVLKHLAIRGLDSVVSCFVYRDLGYLTSALRGVALGLGKRNRVLVAKYNMILPVSRHASQNPTGSNQANFLAGPGYGAGPHQQGGATGKAAP